MDAGRVFRAPDRSLWLAIARLGAVWAIAPLAAGSPRLAGDVPVSPRFVVRCGQTTTGLPTSDLLGSVAAPILAQAREAAARCAMTGAVVLKYAPRRLQLPE